MQSGFFLNVVVGKRSTVFQLFTSENKTLLVWWDTLLVLDLALDVVDGVRRFHFESDRLTGKGLHEDLHTTTETQNQVEGGLLLNVVVGKRTAVLELLSGEDETLLVWRDTLLVLDLALDIVDRVGGLDLKGDRLSREGLDEDLHTSTKTEDKVEGRLLLDVWN